jgi:hypothetical protein
MRHLMPAPADIQMQERTTAGLSPFSSINQAAGMHNTPNGMRPIQTDMAITESSQLSATSADCDMGPHAAHCIV